NHFEETTIILVCASEHALDPCDGNAWGPWRPPMATPTSLRLYQVSLTACIIATSMSAHETQRRRAPMGPPEGGMPPECQPSSGYDWLRNVAAHPYRAYCARPEQRKPQSKLSLTQRSAPDCCAVSGSSCLDASEDASALGPANRPSR